MCRARERLQDLSPFFVFGFQKCREVVLSQQDSARELFKRKADFVFDRLEHQSFLAALFDRTFTPRREVAFVKSHLDILQCSFGTAPAATNSPARSPRLSIDADKRDFRESFARATTQQIPRIVLSFAIGQFSQSSDLIQARCGVVKCQAQGVQQRAFPRAGRAADGKQPG